ncbi:MAG: 8-amino-7-oxononanoate synthase [Pseudanabaenaceae cyanobacterium SKYGB_i_bin29]|nr:8-amino-7-oxononanoate synthase [Pseudanabaenaceae cyanobacterium SKYG29]MDW8421275.1 8-amino-7-oxononanoate synthase [Pseudanabaenaceae cyanobacterium SKYGB_i_bin29]
MPYSWIDHDLQVLKRAKWLRSVTEIPPHFLNFGSNDYLGLAQDDRLKTAAIEAIQQYGTGATGSRLLSGHRDLHQALETKIAHLKGTEAALVFSSGYLANLGTICALVGKRDLILADAYNHSCLVQGCRLSGALVLNYDHLDCNHLQHLLQSNRSSFPRCLIVTNTVFSMDGDIAPLPDIVQLADRFGCMVMVDEAHGTGVFGARGSGIVELQSIDYPLVQAGTLSKAIGSLGGYVAGSAKLIEYLKSRTSTWIYTTALSPADTAAALKAVEIIMTEPERRYKLWDNVFYLRKLLGDEQKYVSPIFPLIGKDIDTVLALSQLCWQEGIYAPAIRPPTVPTARIRLSITAQHSLADLDRVWQLLRRHLAK